MDTENLERRCPRLGGTVPFTYCRICGEDGTYCFKVLDCWWEYFDVAAYLREQLTDEEFQHLTATRPKPKTTSLFELIQQAKERVANSK
jgi:hypothetical protein